MAKRISDEQIAEAAAGIPDPATAESVEAAADQVIAENVNDGIEPGSPDFDWQAEYPDEPVFVFTAANGKTVGIPAFTDERKPNAGFLRKLRKEPPLEQMWTLLELVMSPAALEVSDEFGDDEYQAMYGQWAEWSRTSAGESSR